MILMRILPGVLKELSKHVPTVLFQTVEWGDLASELPKISRRMIQKEGYSELLQHNSKILAPFNVVLSSEHFKATPLIGKLTGEKILTIYFAQLFSAKGIFLDLRSHHFKNDQEILTWGPSGFWAKFDPKFRAGLLKVYEGFYLENNELYFDGLKSIGLIQDDWSEEDKQKLGNLFKSQFGSALHEEMSFNLENFKNSIIAMSDFLLIKKTKISKDFLYLGIYLVTLYSSLEEINEKFPVKEIYLKVKNLNAEPQ